jgi:hypothetical protein
MFYECNRWPEDAAFREAALAVYAQLEGIAAHVMQVIVLSFPFSCFLPFDSVRYAWFVVCAMQCMWCASRVVLLPVCVYALALTAEHVVQALAQALMHLTTCCGGRLRCATTRECR